MDDRKDPVFYRKIHTDDDGSVVELIKATDAFFVDGICYQRNSTVLIIIEEDLKYI